MAKELERPIRETVTPAVLEKIVWAGANLNSFPQASAALKMIGEIDLSAKRVRRITEQIGQDRLDERQQQVAEFKEKPLMQRVQSPADIDSPNLGVVMTDGGRYQRRDHFSEEIYDGSHWKEDKVGIVLHMQSEVHENDPHPSFPEWLAGADVVREIASSGSFDKVKDTVSDCMTNSLQDVSEDNQVDANSTGWSDFAPQLLSKEVIASSECGADFGHHLESVVWQEGVVDAPRTAFVSDGAAVNWTIHKRHFSHMTGILDLMHALSYAYRAARVVEDSTATYQRWAKAIWQGRVADVISELQTEVDKNNRPEDQLEPLRRALTYYKNHRQRMNYPEYRKQGLPLTSSLMESTIKQINIRMKGSEKFFGKATGETLLQLRADSISHSRPLDQFWPRWRSQQTGTNTYRKQAT